MLINASDVSERGGFDYLDGRRVFISTDRSTSDALGILGDDGSGLSAFILNYDNGEDSGRIGQRSRLAPRVIALSLKPVTGGRAGDTRDRAKTSFLIKRCGSRSGCRHRPLTEKAISSRCSGRFRHHRKYDVDPDLPPLLKDQEAKYNNMFIQVI